MPVRLEKVDEQKVTTYAFSCGVLCLKLNVIGRKGWPDRLYLYKGRILFIEFKREDKEPERLQEVVHGQLRKQGFNVIVVDNFAAGRAAIDQLTSGGTHV